MKAPQNDFTNAMKAALSIAQAVWDKSNDVPIGAVVLNGDGEIIGKGGNERELKGDPTAHAEIIALRNAAKKIGSWRLEDCTLVVTLEPCAMCAGAILQSRIPRVVFGAWDEKAGAAGSLWDLLRDRRSLHQVEVIPGVLENRSQELLKKFFESVR